MDKDDDPSKGQNRIAGEARVRAWLGIREPLERQLEPMDEQPPLGFICASASGC